MCYYQFNRQKIWRKQKKDIRKEKLQSIILKNEEVINSVQRIGTKTCQ